MISDKTFIPRQNRPLIVNGLKRSGNHLVIGWLVDNLGMKFENWINGRNQHYHFEPPTMRETLYRSGTIYTFEDITLDQLRAYNTDGFVTVAIHRSLDNLVSSRVVAFIGNPSIGRPGFVDYADEIEDGIFSPRLLEAEASLIGAFSADLPRYSLTIFYDHFLVDLQYRAAILDGLRNLGFAVPSQVRDSSLEQVSEIGFGSSFLPAGQREVDLRRYFSRAEQLTEPQSRAFTAVKAALAKTKSPDRFSDVVAD